MADKKIPPEFPSAWHFEAHLEALERELAGRLARKAELEAMDAHPRIIREVDAEITAVRENLERYGVGQKQASTRPAESGTTRTRKK